MTQPSLQFSTGNAVIDETLISTIRTFMEAFPGLIYACYLEGSYANHSEVSSSDLDLTFVFKKAPIADERERVQQVVQQCKDGSSLELDIEITDGDELAPGAPPMLKLAGKLLYGENILEGVPLLPIEEWTRNRMHSSYFLLSRVFNRPSVISPPVLYPDPHDEFYGYANRMIRLADGTEQRSTRNLIRVSGWMGTALVALEAQQFVANKRDCSRMYKQWIGDEWTTLLEEIYTCCRGRWNYLIPAEPEERQRLQMICARTRDWENHFLGLYKPFLLAELQSQTRSVRTKAAWLMGQVPYNDPDIVWVLQRLHDSEDNELVSSCETALQKVRAPK